MLQCKHKSRKTLQSPDVNQKSAISIDIILLDRESKFIRIIGVTLLEKEVTKFGGIRLVKKSLRGLGVK